MGILKNLIAVLFTVVARALTDRFADQAKKDRAK